MAKERGSKTGTGDRRGGGIWYNGCLMRLHRAWTMGKTRTPTTHGPSLHSENMQLLRYRDRLQIQPLLLSWSRRSCSACLVSLSPIRFKPCAPGNCLDELTTRLFVKYAGRCSSRRFNLVPMYLHLRHHDA